MRLNGWNAVSERKEGSLKWGWVVRETRELTAVNLAQEMTAGESEWKWAGR
jgi:hypothetical protein